MAPRTVVRQLMRLKDHDGATLRYYTPPGSRSRPYHWYDLDQIPPFDGETAWFELRRRPDGGWEVLGRVERGAD